MVRGLKLLKIKRKRKSIYRGDCDSIMENNEEMIKLLSVDGQ